MTKPFIYLDYAAATPLDDKVFAAMRPYFADAFYNPSAPYQPAREVKADIETARCSVAQILGCRDTEIVFTAGATESINLALSLEGHIVTIATEHPAVLQTTQARPASDYAIVKVDAKGRVDMVSLQQAIKPETTLVSIALINNETGTLQDIKAISQLVKAERARRQEQNNSSPIYLHTDASQAAGFVDLHVTRLGVDMMTLNAGKVYGPKQMGLLYASSTVKLPSLIHGGGQERNLRSGTENVAGIIGFAKALELSESKRKTEPGRLQAIRTQLLDILEANFAELQVMGDQKHYCPHILCVAIEGLDAERVLFALENEGVLVATGSACAANKDTRSHVLSALGLAPEIIDGSLRFSFGRQTTTEQIARAGKIIVMAIKKEISRGSSR